MATELQAVEPRVPPGARGGQVHRGRERELAQGAGHHGGAQEHRECNIYDHGRGATSQMECEQHAGLAGAVMSVIGKNELIYLKKCGVMIILVSDFL